MAPLPEPPAMTYAPEYYNQRVYLRSPVLSPDSGGPSPSKNSFTMPIAPGIHPPPRVVRHIRSQESVSQNSTSQPSSPSSPTPLTAPSKNGSFSTKREPPAINGRAGERPCAQCKNESRVPGGDRDIEKQASQSNESRRSRAPTSAAGHSTRSHRPHQTPKEFLKQKTPSILLYLSFINIFVSFLACGWTLISLAGVLAIQPIKVCAKRGSFQQQLTNFLAPTLNTQLRYIHSTKSSLNYSLPMLLVVLFLSPIVSLGVALAAGISAIFWLFCLVMGDPDGTDRHNDGRNAVLALRAWWEKWLARALR